MAGWPLQRQKRSERPVPAEVQEYYRAEQRERMGVAWLIAFLSLLISVIVLLGIFFGGRWAWRKITQGDKKQPTTVQTDDTNTNEQKPTELPGDTTKQTDPTDRNANNNGAGSANSNNANSSSSTANNPSQPNLVRTGPDLDL